MKSKINSLLLLAFLVGTVSCSQKGSEVKIEVSHFQVGSSAAIQAMSGGGLVIWAKSEDGKSFAQTLDTTNDSISLALPNGLWTFYAMAWDGLKNYQGTASTNYNFGGVVSCAKSGQVVLSGNKAAVDLTLNNSNCTDAVFAGSVPTTVASSKIVLAPTRFAFCNGINQITSSSDLCADTRNEVRAKEKKAWIGSFRVNMKLFKKFGATKDFTGIVQSPCTEMVGNPEGTEAAGDISEDYGSSGLVIPSLPAGGPGLPFHLEIEMFPGNSKCDVTASGSVGNRGSIVRQFPNGIASADGVANKYLPNSTFHKQYLAIPSAQICQNRNSTGLPDHPFAAGEGLTREHPYIICSVPQFHAINNDINYLSKHYKLESDLDFNPYSQGLAGTGVVPSYFQCLELGSNILPIGYYAATCAGPGNPIGYGAMENFTGSFDGRNYKLSNLRLRDDSQTNIGIFGSINGSATTVSNLRVENVEFEGRNTVGALTGIVSGSSGPSSVKIWNIHVSKADVQARDSSGDSFVGGLFGIFDKATLSNASIKDSRVRGEHSKVGGVIGFASSAIIDHVAADVNLDANSSVSPKYYIGGVVGLAQDVALNLVRHEGAIYSNAQKVGGILGGTSGSTSLIDFYANSHVTSNDTSPTVYLGGVVGVWSSDITAQIGPGYTMSIIRTNCQSACNQGPMVGTVSTQPTSQVGLYRLPTTETNPGPAQGVFAGEIEIPSISDMKVPANVPSLTSSGTDDWSIMPGEYPRLDFEKHPCTTVAGFSGSGAGTLLNPKNICNETQYLALSGAAANTHHKLVSNIRLTMSSGSQFDLNSFSASLDGNNRMLLGGFSSVSTSPSGHIGTIASTAVIKNLQIHGLGRQSTDSGTTLSNPHGVFAATNNGKINNVQFWTYGNYAKMGASIVGQNSASGEIKNVTVAGDLTAHDDGAASVAIKNSGLIERVSTNVEIFCKVGICDRIAGLVVHNDGSIKKSEMGSRLRTDSSYTSINTSMVVDTNTSLIEDVLVSKHAEFEVTSNPKYFHRVNSGTLRRVINNGYMKTHLYNSDYNDTLTGFPTAASAISSDTGTHEDVFRSGGRSGKLLIKNAAFTCAVADQVRIPTWSSISDFGSYNTAWSGGGYNGGARKMMIELDTGMYKTTERVLSYDEANYDFGVTTTRCAAGLSGKATIWVTDDEAMDVGGIAAAGTKLPQHVLYGNFSTNFQAVMWDDMSNAHTAQKLAYYAFILGVTTTPALPRTWNLESEGLHIFELDN
jgi:hypothetical protein